MCTVLDIESHSVEDAGVDSLLSIDVLLAHLQLIHYDLHNLLIVSLEVFL